MIKKILHSLPRGTILLIAILLMSILVRLLMGYRIHHSAWLYVGVPTIIAWILLQIRPAPDPGFWAQKYLRHLVDACIVMFGSAMILFEGFICVLMFLPIYLLVCLLVFLIEFAIRRCRASGRSTLGVHVLPLLLLVSSFEGVLPVFSFERADQVSVTRILPASVAEIQANLLSPINLQRNRHWFLQLFPMPHRINAGGIKVGDLHSVELRYHRWFITNTHEGSVRFEIVESSPQRITTRFIEDTSYFNNYLKLQGTEIRFNPLADGSTEVTFSISYERKLDPYWYFGPLQRYGVATAADFLMTEVIARDNT